MVNSYHLTENFALFLPASEEEELSKTLDREKIALTTAADGGDSPASARPIEVVPDQSARYCIWCHFAILFLQTVINWTMTMKFWD